MGTAIAYYLRTRREARPMTNGPKYKKCEDIALEAERLLDDGYVEAARIIHARVAETCVFGPVPCPMNSDCRVAVQRVQAKLDTFA